MECWSSTHSYLNVLLNLHSRLDGHLVIQYTYEAMYKWRQLIFGIFYMIIGSILSFFQSWGTPTVIQSPRHDSTRRLERTNSRTQTDKRGHTAGRRSQSFELGRKEERRGPESSNWSFPSFSRSSKEQHNGSPVQPNNRTRTLRPRLPLWTCPLCILKRTREDGGRGVRWRRKKSDERPTRRTRDEKEGAQLCILLCCNFAGSLDWNWGIIMKNAKIRYVSFSKISSFSSIEKGKAPF